MSSSTGIFAIILSAVLTNNFIFSQFLGCCPFLGCSSKIDTAAGMALGIYLPLITTNCAVLGVVLLNTQYTFGFVQSVVYGVFGGLGFMLAICLFASVREKLEFADYPECFEGFPICLVSAGLLALAFMGFSGMKIG